MKELKDDAERDKQIVLVGVDGKTKIKRAQMNESAWNNFIKRLMN